MQEPSKTKTAKALRNLIYTTLFVSIVAAGVFTFATKTDDFLRDMLIKHSNFIDPSSAIFRNVTYASETYGLFGVNIKTWCGEVNVKNQLGGYVGWRPFKITTHNYDDEVGVYIRELGEKPFGKLNDGPEIVLHGACRFAEPAPLWTPMW